MGGGFGLTYADPIGRVDYGAAGLKGRLCGVNGVQILRQRAPRGP